MLLEKDRMFLEKALTSCVSVQALEAVVVVAMLQICISGQFASDSNSSTNVSRNLP